MPNLKDQFLQTVKMFPEATNGTILLGLSGGIDSVVLFHLLHSCGIKFAVAHCNFQLRGSESDHDEVFVNELSKEHGIEFFSKQMNTTVYASEHGISIQMAARQLRLDYMNEIFHSKKYACICLAHHLDDNIETFFLNLIRGTGLKGLKGMSVFSATIFRPLLLTTRTEIKKYADFHNLSHREDSSNAKDDYIRNRIRHHVIPAVEKTFPRFNEVMKENLTRFSNGVSLYEKLCLFAAEYCTEKQKKYFIVHLDKLKKFGNDELLLAEIILPYGFTHHHAIQILENTESNETRKFYSSSHSAYLKNNTLEIHNTGILQNRSFYIENIYGFEDSDCPLKIHAEILTNSSSTELRHNSAHAFFDLSKLKFPLLLRPREQGDTFHPFGMKGKKLITDLMNDLKLSEIQKKNVLLLCSEDQIIWVPGMRNADVFKVTTETIEILHLQLIEPPNI